MVTHVRRFVTLGNGVAGPPFAKYVDRRVDVPVRGETATWTFVHAYVQAFLHIRSALGAHLGSPSGIHFDDLLTGAFCLVKDPYPK